MVNEYQKGQEIEVSPEFHSYDFDCKCAFPDCKITLIDEKLVAALDALALVFPIVNIHSGFRCAAHNKQVGGKVDSYHLLGMAADVSTPFAMSKEVANAAEKIWDLENGGIGLYSSFVHLDVRGHKARW